MAITKEEAIQIDYEKAKKYIRDYQTIIQNQIIARGNILSGAIQEYNSFLNLPASSNTGAAIWEFAFSLLTFAIPALKIGEFITKQHEAASQALAAARIFQTAPKKGAKAVKVVTGGLKIVGSVATTGNTAKELVDKASKISPSAAELTKHASRAPILEIIRELTRATDMCMEAENAVMQEWINRVDDAPFKESLEDMAKRLLKDPPAMFGESELDEIWNAYLWMMITSYVASTVVRERTTHDKGWNRGKTVKIEYKGLNDTQEKAILDLFGPKATRGKIFIQKPVTSMVDFYTRLNIKTVEIYIEPVWTGRMQ